MQSTLDARITKVSWIFEIQLKKLKLKLFLVASLLIPPPLNDTAIKKWFLRPPLRKIFVLKRKKKKIKFINDDHEDDEPIPLHYIIARIKPVYVMMKGTT